MAAWFCDTLVRTDDPALVQPGARRAIHPKILRGEISWCRDVSDPDAGAGPVRPSATSALLEMPSRVAWNVLPGG